MTRVFVTGAAGYMGGVFLRELGSPAVAADVRAVPCDKRLPGVEYLVADVRSPDLGRLMRESGASVVVHLASIVTPGPDSSRELEYSVDVLGTENVLKACVEAGVRRLVVTSSGAAYGYHADNPEPLREDDPLRGNDEFAYSRHKRLVEEMLARWRRDRPELEQVVFRVGTILGEGTRNQITALFDRPRILTLRGARTPFVFAWDRDVARALVAAVSSPNTGVFNLAGDGALGLREIAGLLGKPCVEVPPSLLRAALAVLKPLGLTPYGPEQVDFLRYRPVLDNRRLKEEFGYTPRLSSAQVFDPWRAAQQAKAL